MTTPQHHDKVYELFCGACELHGQERTAFLDRQCAGESALRAEVEALLVAARSASSGSMELILEAGLRPTVESQRASGSSTLELPTGQDRHGKMSTLPGEVQPIPDYDFVEVCGEGAFGCVSLVRNRAGVHMALKIIEKSRLAFAGIADREMQALGHYCNKVPDHPNLIKIFHIGHLDRLLYYTMELADNMSTKKPVRGALNERYTPMTLSAILADGRLKTDTAVEIALRLLKGLECLHRAGLVHRDIKPANVIFVNRDVKLADIGLVSAVHSKLSKAGTPSYMPPDERMDTTADTFAIGKILHQMICGGDLSCFPRLPADERIGSEIMDVRRIEQFLCKACELSARDRFGSALEMRVALQSCRLPTLESPFVELADRQVRATLDGTALALSSVSQDRPAADYPQSKLGQEELEQQHPKYIIGHTPSGKVSIVWQVLDRLIKVLPWAVVLVLGYILIDRLTR